MYDYEIALENPILTSVIAVLKVSAPLLVSFMLISLTEQVSIRNHLRLEIEIEAALELDRYYETEEDIQK